MVDLLWSDPTDNGEPGIQTHQERDPNGAGSIVKFGPDRVEKFLKTNSLSLILRSHQVVMDGYENFADGQMITFTSSTDYCGTHGNLASMLVVSKTLEITPKIIKPQNKAKQWPDEPLEPVTPPRASKKAL